MKKNIKINYLALHVNGTTKRAVTLQADEKVLGNNCRFGVGLGYVDKKGNIIRENAAYFLLLENAQTFYNELIKKYIFGYEK